MPLDGFRNGDHRRLIPPSSAKSRGYPRPVEFHLQLDFLIRFREGIDDPLQAERYEADSITIGAICHPPLPPAARRRPRQRASRHLGRQDRSAWSAEGTEGGDGREVQACAFLARILEKLEHGLFCRDDVLRQALAHLRYRNPYQMRHTFASQLLSQGENPAYIAKLLGHKTTEMVIRNYGRWVEQGATLGFDRPQVKYGREHLPGLPEVGDASDSGANRV
ncbi:Phage integrase family protein [Variovorax sp. YR752]|nr:Phage integrase family protein [Variovorax sp. YR752]